MTTNNQNQNPYQPAPNPYQPQAQPNPNAGNYGTEFAEEQNAPNAFETEFANEQNPLNNATNQAEHKSAQKEMEKKDARGGNHNPEGASGFTSGRVDDKGKKSKKDDMEKKSADPKAKDEARTHPNSGVGFTDDERTGGNV